MIGAFLNNLIMHQADGSVTHRVPDVLLEVFKVSVFVARQNSLSNTMVSLWRDYACLSRLSKNIHVHVSEKRISMIKLLYCQENKHIKE